MLIIEVILQIKKILYTRSLTSSFKKFTFQWFLNIFLTIFRTRILIRVKSTENQPRRNGKRWWNTLVVKFATLYRRRKKSLSPEIRTRRDDKRRIKKQREQSVGKALKGIKEGWWEGGWEWRMTERNKVQRRGFFSFYRRASIDPSLLENIVKNNLFEMHCYTSVENLISNEMNSRSDGKRKRMNRKKGGGK